MNLSKLFELQKMLDAEIIKKKGLEDMDRLPYLILALQVELGECANEWRGFKYWSNDQEPRREVKCESCSGNGFYLWGEHGSKDVCDDCWGTGVSEEDPLLEEYVDCLHFILSIGNFIGYNFEEAMYLIEPNVKIFKSCHGIVDQFNEIFSSIVGFKNDTSEFELYEDIPLYFLALGEMLGFTIEQIEQAYMDKNAVNHERQLNGY